MGEIRLKISDLFVLDGEGSVNPAKNLATVTAYVLKHYAFLPKPLTVTIEADEAVLRFPKEESAAQAEAARLADKAVKRAGEGNYEKAINIYKRVLELQPSFHAARRDLAMAYVELGDVDSATNHLIEVLRLSPQDAWSWVVLANLYISEKSDLETGEKFLRKALEIAPDDSWALNSLAAIHQERGEVDKAIALYERAIEANPDFANPYYGEAVTFNASDQSDKALVVLNRMFASAKMQDARSLPVFENARRLFFQLQVARAESYQSEAFKVVQDYKAEMESLSGFPIRIEETDFEDMVGATIQIGWKHGRDYHLIRTRRGFPRPLISHLELHELTHLKLESEARKIGRNLFFATTAKTRETAIRSISGDIRKLEKEGYSEESITKVTLSMVGGLCGFLFNCPLDMLIERHLREAFAPVRPAQFVSVSKLATEAWQTNSNPDIRKMTPRKIMRSSLALNGAYALFLDDLSQGASAFTTPYSRLDTFELSARLWDHWQERSKQLAPGDEYPLVDDFADMIGLRDWYEWKPDPGQHEITEDQPKQGTTNPSLLKEKHPAAIFYFLDAFKRFDRMTNEEVRDVAFEIAMTGRNGLDYAKPDETYKLQAIPGRNFSGLHLMCLMYAGFKRVAPEQDVGMDLNEPFLQALSLYNAKRDVS